MIPDPYFSLRELIDEDFVNYYKPSMFIGVPYCDFKCNKEAGTKVCHNLKLVMQRLVRISVKELIERYLANPITKAIVFGGLEPFYLYRENETIIDTAGNIASFLMELRHTYKCKDDVVIYTGYTEEEIFKGRNGFIVPALFPLVIKYGRYIPNNESHIDPVLQVKLASSNQYAKRYE